MNGTPLPAALEVRELLEGLVGRDFDTKTGGPMVDPAKGACVAEYVDDQMQLAAVIAADLGLASAAGSAIGLIPAIAAHMVANACSISLAMVVG